MSKLALAMIVKGDKEEAKLLARCLENVAPCVDAIFITRTNLPGQAPSEHVAKVARKYKAHLSDFEWRYDFAAARNFNFSQVPSEFDYIMWTDADDIWRGLEKLRSTMAKSPSMDGFGFKYLYDWDETKRPTVVHRKTMIIRNDGSATWVGAIHEDLIENRALEIQLINDIERLHLTNPTRTAESALRNLDISKRAMEEKPDDPRSLFNLANAEFGVGNYTRAQRVFEEFVEETESDDERYLAHLRLADVLKANGDVAGGIRHLQLAIGLMPYVPDAYFQMGQLYFSISNFDKAEEYILNGLKKRPQVEKMIVYNPRDYDYNPLMLLARVYYEKNRPDLMLPLLKGCAKIYPDDKDLKELVRQGVAERRKLARALVTVQKLQKIKDKDRLRRELAKLPPEIQSHPAVCVLRNQNFVKETSSGRDLVIYAGNTAHQWNGELFKTKGFGGSEEAVVHLAREWAKLGWNVTVYNNCGHKAVVESVETVGSHGEVYTSTEWKVTYRPFWEFNYRDKQDVVILWRWAKPLDAGINCERIYVDLHDVIPPGEFTEKRLEVLSKVFFKTEFHRSLFPNVPDDKCVVIPNGLERYPDPSIQKDPYLIINTSSPDRSMDVLPKLFTEVKKQVPQARLQWAYGWDNFKTGHANDSKKLAWMKETQKAMEEAGIEDLGRLSQAEVGKLYERASFFAYPTEFAEIDCISVKKAQAALCYPVATTFGALKESIKFGALIKSEKNQSDWNRPYQFTFGLEKEDLQEAWVAVMVYRLRLGYAWDRDEVVAWVKQYEWSAIAKRWTDVWSKA